MSQYKNRRVILIERAKALPKTELFSVIEDDAPEPSSGEVLLQNIYVTADPGMKGWISNAKKLCQRRDWGYYELIRGWHRY